jgi:Nucleotidyl transferase AbiEii toxin, Type IV TA system
MTPRKSPKNIAASVRQRLLNLAREREVEFERVLTEYAIERWLYRLGRSKHADLLVLKGAQLFSVWAEVPHRPTRDLDFLGKGKLGSAEVERIVRAVCKTPCEVDDGIRFLEKTVRGEEIRENAAHGGVRITLQATLGEARIRIQIDVGFGDTVVPDPERIEFPVLLDLPAPEVSAYPRESVVAEKFEAIVRFGIANSRMKDYFDLWVLIREFSFDGEPLSRALNATLENRETSLPTEMPVGLSSEFALDPSKQTQWRAFLNRGRLENKAPDMEETVQALRNFMEPLRSVIVTGQIFMGTWPPGGPWNKT